VRAKSYIIKKVALKWIFYFYSFYSSKIPKK